eukprot:6619188-Prymnesium_polylepis.1
MRPRSHKARPNSCDAPRGRAAPRKRRGPARPTMVGPRRGDFAFFRPLNAHFLQKNCIFRPPH